VAMIGGGSALMRPGEISLAHGGVLFLDEMGEFPTDVLDALRLPLEEGEVRVSRARATAAFPARFILVGAMNPCPCGEGGIPGRCRCSPVARERYARRLSAPLLDRFDIAVRVEPPSFSELSGRLPSESTAQVAARVARVRHRALVRGVGANAALPVSMLSSVAPLDSAALRVIERQVGSGALSARGVHRVQRLARTLADLDNDGDGDVIGEAHVSEALRLRCQRELLLGDQR